MKEILCLQSKETRCYIMSAVLFFEGFNQINDMTGFGVKLSLDTLGLTKENIERFPIPDYSQIVSHLQPISDHEVKSWIINNTYASVLESKRADALRAFRTFCADLRWDANEIKETMKLTEEVYELKPVSVYDGANTTSSGCFSVILMIIVCTLLITMI